MARKSAIAAISVLCGLFVGCQQVNQDLAEGVRRGERYYRQGNYTAAEQTLTQAINADRSSPVAAEGYYIRGLTRLKRGQINNAESDFVCAIELGDRDEIKTNCQVCLGSIAYERDNFSKAYAYYMLASQHLVQMSPNDWVLYRLGDAAQKVGKWREARKVFARLIRDFPDSEAAKSARKRLNYSYFTIQAGAFNKHSNASDRLDQLQRASIPARAEVIPRGASTLQVVYVGKYSNFKSAQEMLDKVRMVVPDARIVP